MNLEKSERNQDSYGLLMANHGSMKGKKINATQENSPVRERHGLKSLTAIRNLPIGKYEAVKAEEMLKQRPEHMNVQKLAVERLQDKVLALELEETQ